LSIVKDKNPGKKNKLIFKIGQGRSGDGKEPLQSGNPRQHEKS
jgi:hypothetical protein